MKNDLQKNIGIMTAAVFALCFTIGLFAQPEAAAAGISDGLLLCVKVIIPSLFPFIALAAFISKSGVADWLGRRLSPVTRLLFHMPGTAACTILMGMIGGYPVGSKMIAGLYQEQKINRQDAHRLFLYCVNPGPAFAISAVGVSVLGSRQSGLLLFASLLLSSVFLGVLSGIVHRKDPVDSAGKGQEKRQSLADAYVESVADASGTMYGICAWVVLFSSIITLICLLPMPPQIHTLVSCILECSRGVSSLPVHSLPLLAAILGWGGVCVHCQVLPYVLKTGMSPLRFLLGRAAHAATAYAAARILLLLFPQPVTAFSSGAQPLPAFAAGSIPAAVGLLVMSGLLILDVDRNKKIC